MRTKIVLRLVILCYTDEHEMKFGLIGQADTQRKTRC